MRNMNNLRRLFNPTPKEEEEFRQKLNKIIQRQKDDKHCSFCIHAIEHPHIEMGYESGTDIYCDILEEWRLTYPTGQECPYWEMKGEE